MGFRKKWVLYLLACAALLISVFVGIAVLMGYAENQCWEREAQKVFKYYEDPEERKELLANVTPKPNSVVTFSVFAPTGCSLGGYSETIAQLHFTKTATVKKIRVFKLYGPSSDDEGRDYLGNGEDLTEDLFIAEKFYSAE